MSLVHNDHADLRDLISTRCGVDHDRRRVSLDGSDGIRGTGHEGEDGYNRAAGGRFILRSHIISRVRWVLVSIEGIGHEGEDGYTRAAGGRISFRGRSVGCGIDGKDRTKAFTINTATIEVSRARQKVIEHGCPDES